MAPSDSSSFIGPKVAGVNHGAQADDADVQSGLAKHAVFHGNQHRIAVATIARDSDRSAWELSRCGNRWSYWNTRMDTTYPLYYNGPAVSQIKVRQQGQERFSSEIMTYLDHLYRVAFHLARNDDEAQDCVQETCARGARRLWSIRARQQHESVVDEDSL
jgi:hypothetical protein